MTVRLYRSTDASAPSLTGQAGSLVTLLDAVLVNGYGSAAAAGWAKSFSGTNKATYRNSASAGTGMYLYVDDTATGTGATAREARMTGFETQSAIGVGTGMFPSATQSSPANSAYGYVICRKSNTADSTTRAWTLLADETVFYLFVSSGDSTVGMTSFYFGDAYSYKSNDAYRCTIAGRFAENSSIMSNSAEYLTQLAGYGVLEASNNLGMYIARSYTGWGGSMSTSQISAVATSSTTNQLLSNYVSAVYTYPNATDGSLLLAPIYLIHNRAVRGYRKGLWVSLQNRPCTTNDTFSGSSAGGLNGKTFLALDLGANATAQIILETSNTW